MHRVSGPSIYFCTKTRKSSDDSYSIIIMNLRSDIFVLLTMPYLFHSYCRLETRTLRILNTNTLWCETSTYGHWPTNGDSAIRFARVWWIYDGRVQYYNLLFDLPTINVLFWCNRFCVIQVNSRRFTCASEKKLAKKPEVIAANKTHPARKSNRAISTAP